MAAISITLWIPQPSPLLRRRHETVPEPFSYLARRFLHTRDRWRLHSLYRRGTCPVNGHRPRGWTSDLFSSQPRPELWGSPVESWLHPWWPSNQLGVLHHLCIVPVYKRYLSDINQCCRTSCCTYFHRINIIFFLYIFLENQRFLFLNFSPLSPLTEVSLQPTAIPGGKPPGDRQSAVGWGDTGFKPGTAGQLSGPLPLSHHASFLSHHASLLSHHASLKQFKQKIFYVCIHSCVLSMSYYFYFSVQQIHMRTHKF
jgi:hypothetical protein